MCVYKSRSWAKSERRLPGHIRWVDKVKDSILRENIACGSYGAFDLFCTFTYQEHDSWDAAIAYLNSQLDRYVYSLSKWGLASRAARHALACVVYDQQPERAKAGLWRDMCHAHALIRLGGPRLGLVAREAISRALVREWQSVTPEAKAAQLQYGVKCGSADVQPYNKFGGAEAYMVDGHKYAYRREFCPRQHSRCKRGMCRHPVHRIVEAWR